MNDNTSKRNTPWNRTYSVNEDEEKERARRIVRTSKINKLHVSSVCIRMISIVDERDRARKMNKTKRASMKLQWVEKVQANDEKREKTSTTTTRARTTTTYEDQKKKEEFFFHFSSWKTHMWCTKVSPHTLLFSSDSVFLLFSFVSNEE